MDAHMHFDLYDDRSEILRYVKQKASYTIAMTNLPQVKNIQLILMMRYTSI